MINPTEECLDAILCVAGAEGILLDPVYTGKMFSGFLDHCQAGRWGSGQSALLLHSGGVRVLFTNHAPIEAHLRKRGI